jgi:hypothetical protein
MRNEKHTMKFGIGDLVRYYNDNNSFGVVIDVIERNNKRNIYKVQWLNRTIIQNNGDIGPSLAFACSYNELIKVS